MDSDLAGRVRNTSLPKSKNLLPFFEAVVNSIQALDDSSRPPEERRIEVEIIRHPVLKEGKDGNVIVVISHGTLECEEKFPLRKLVKRFF